MKRHTLLNPSESIESIECYPHVNGTHHHIFCKKTLEFSGNDCNFAVEKYF